MSGLLHFRVVLAYAFTKLMFHGVLSCSSTELACCCLPRGRRVSWDAFPGLGWMLKKEMFKELYPHWTEVREWPVGKPNQRTAFGG